MSPTPGRLRAVRGPQGAPGDAPPPIILAAAQSVSHTWQELLRESFEPREVADVVDWIVTSVQRASTASELTPPEGQMALTRFLLERLHGTVLDQLTSAPTISAPEAIGLLRAIDAVRQATEPEWDRYFASQISGPDGLNLVLEVAHDLRSPLTSIRCLAETIERGYSGPVTDIQRKQLRLIYSASLGLGSLATDVIEMARRGDQLVDGEVVPFSVAEVLSGVADLVRPMAEEKGIEFSYQTLGTDQRAGMPTALGRVLLNLVTNALKFTDEGRVEVRAKPLTMSRVEFSVSDTGHGIPESAIPDLFRPFRRGPQRGGRSGYLFSGTGLGLALCRKLLRAMDSDLRFESAVGTGTRFFFELELPPSTRL